MRLAAVLAAVVALIAAFVAFAARSSGAAAQDTSSTRAKAEIAALQRAEASFYAKRKRYSGRLADLWATRAFTDIAINSPGLDIHLDVSSDGKTVLLRVNSPTIGLGRVLRGGQEVGQMCQVLGGNARCGPR
jgi:hypothetical protein